MAEDRKTLIKYFLALLLCMTVFFLPAEGASAGTDGNEYLNINALSGEAQIQSGAYYVFEANISTNLTKNNKTHRMITAAEDIHEIRNPDSARTASNASFSSWDDNVLTNTNQNYVFQITAVNGETDNGNQGYKIKNAGKSLYLAVKQGRQPAFNNFPSTFPNGTTADGRILPTYPYTYLGSADSAAIWYWDSTNKEFYTYYTTPGEMALGGQIMVVQRDPLIEYLVAWENEKLYRIWWHTDLANYAYADRDKFPHIETGIMEFSWGDHQKFVLKAFNTTDYQRFTWAYEIPAEQYRDPLYTYGRTLGLTREQCAEENMSTAMLGLHHINPNPNGTSSTYWPFQDKGGSEEADLNIYKKISSPQVRFYHNDGSGNTTVKTYAYNEKIDFSLSSGTRKFIGWSTTANGSAIQGDIYVTNDMELFGVWEQYNINIQSEPTGGEISTDNNFSTKMDKGATFTCTASPYIGYVFKHWIVNGTNDSTEADHLFTVTGDMDISAVFEKTVEGAFVSMTTSYEYTGSEVVLDARVKWAGSTGSVYMTEGSDYEAEFLNGNGDVIPVPTDADSYQVRFRGKGEYVGVTLAEAFAITRASIHPEMDDYSGTCQDIGYAPTVNGNSGSGTVSYKYKVKGSENSTYKDGLPAAVGTYIICATVAETRNYQQGTVEAEYQISHVWKAPVYSWEDDFSKVTALRVCEFNDAQENDEAVPTPAVTRQPTELLEGETTYTAVFTNPAFGTVTKPAPIAKLAVRHVERVEPKCTEEGNIEYWICDDNGHIYKDEALSVPLSGGESVVLQAAGHKMVITEKVEATCTLDGSEVYWTCTSCRKKFSDAEGRNEIEKPAGIAAKGHAWSEWSITKQPGANEEGEKQRVCSNDPSHVEKQTIPATGEPQTVPDQDNKEDKKDNPPEDDKQNNTPAEDNKDNTSADDKQDNTPKENNKDSTPADDKQDNTPKENNKDNTPADDKQDSTPKNKNKDNTPADDKQDNTPKEDNKDNPSADDKQGKAEPENETPEEKAARTAAAEKAKAKISLNAGLKGTSSGEQIIFQWGKVKNATKYMVYASYCGGKQHPTMYKKIKTIKAPATKYVFSKLDGKKLNLKKNVKVYVAAYRGKTELAKSLCLHIAGSESKKYSNVKKVKLTQTSYTIKTGKTKAIKPTAVLVDSSKIMIPGHCNDFRYATSNKEIATVDKNGIIRAIGKGKCTIYVYSKNGYPAKIKVSVR